MPQVITTQDSDSKGNIIHTETEASVVTYKDSDTVENNLNNLNDREELFVTDTKPTKKGFWINKSEQVIGSNSNTIVDRLKKYMDSKIGILSELLTTKKSNLVEAINENTTGITKIKENVESNTLQLKEMVKPNLLINDCFQVWQRGESFTIDGAIKYTADRWCVWTGMDGVTVNKNQGIISIGCKGNDNLIQMVELPKSIQGNSMVISSKIKVPVGSRVKLRADYVENGSITGTVVKRAEKIYDGTGLWNTVILNIPEEITNTNILRVLISMDSTCTDKIVEIKNVKLELGSVATPFVPRPYGEELALCQRYYEVSDEGAPFKRITNLKQESTGVLDLGVFEYFAVTKRIRPTITLYYDITDGNPEISNANSFSFTHGFSPNILLPSKAFLDINKWEADAEIY